MFDYLAIGHVTNDVTPDGYVIGGTVAYAGRTAQVLGCRTAILTSAAPDCDLQEALPDITVQSVPASETTTFENIYLPTGRKQYIHGRAKPLRVDDVPVSWRHTPIVHLAPVADEVDPDMIQVFSTSLVGMTPQGWLRTWDSSNHVLARAWPEAKQVLPLAAAVILSEEDLPDEAVLAEFKQWSRLLVLTQGARGCTVFLDGEQRQFPAPEVVEVNPTGAGDIFAAAFLYRLYQTKGNAWEAAIFANQIASQSVAQTDLESKVMSLQVVQD